MTLFNTFSELAELVPLTCFREMCTRYSIRLHDFHVTIYRCWEDTNVNKFLSRIARIENSLHAECVPLICDLSGFKSSVNRPLLYLCVLLISFPICFSFYSSSFSCNSNPSSDCSAFFGVKPNKKIKLHN